jgi:hypothetical protein
MHRTNVLVDAPNHDGLLIPSEGTQRREGIIGLRRKYTSYEGVPAAAIQYYKRFRELHPFNVSFMARWAAFSTEQHLRMELLTSLIDLGPISFDLSQPPLTPKPRAALVIACSRYSESRWKSYPQIETIAKTLEKVLQTVAQFDHVRLILNPKNQDEMLAAVDECLDTVNDKGLFGFWFLGHGKPNAQGHLELLHTESKDHGVPWSSFCERLRDRPKLLKVLILDCCFAGAAGHEDPAVPANSYVWCSSKATDLAAFQVENGELKCFTDRAARILLEGNPDSDAQTITFAKWFELVQQHCADVSAALDKSGSKIPETGAAINLGNRCRHCGPARDLLKKQILEGRRA